MSGIYAGTSIAMVVVSAIAVVSLRPKGIRERKGGRGVVTWAGFSAMALVVGSAMGLGAVWLFRLLMTFLFHTIMGESELWGVWFGTMMGSLAGVLMTVAISMGINESYEDPAKVRRGRPRVRARKKPRLPG